MAKAKKIILYGNADCPDCMSAKAALEKAVALWLCGCSGRFGPTKSS